MRATGALRTPPGVSGAPADPAPRPRPIEAIGCETIGRQIAIRMPHVPARPDPHTAVPTYEPPLARLAAMIADPARSRMLAYLLDGHYASAGELAAAASVVASTASGHLAKLRQAGLLVAEQRGRHRYFKLADADVAHALEALALVAERGAHERRWASPARQQLRFARCCYGHLAGELGVRLMGSLLRAGCLVADGAQFRLTTTGEAWLAEIGLAPPKATGSQRLAYACLDWSERRDHLAGVLAACLLEHFIARRWLVREANRGAGSALAVRNRALRLTARGKAELLAQLGG